MNDDLAGYIRKYSGAYSDADIRRSLENDGFPAEDIAAAFETVKASRRRARDRHPFLIAGFFIAAAVLTIGLWLAVRPKPRLAAPGLDYFPLNVGDRWVYMSYNINPDRPQEYGLEKLSLWFEVVGHRVLHGVDLYLVQESYGGLVRQGTQWLPGTPEQWRGDLIYLKTADGVDWREAHYGATNEELMASRRDALEKFSAMDQETMESMAHKNRILKTPIRAGDTWNAEDYACKTVGIVSMKGAFRRQADQAVRVDVSLGSKPVVTRFFIAGQGLAFATQAAPNNEKYPLHVQELYRYYPAGTMPDVHGTPDPDKDPADSDNPLNGSDPDER